MNIIFTDTEGNETHFAKKNYDLKYSFARQGGPLTAEITLPIDLIDPIKILTDVKIYDGLDLIWNGRVFEVPRVTIDKQAAVINALGNINNLTDQSFRRHYSDESYNAWDVTPPTPPTESWYWEKAERDNNNRVFLRLPKDEEVTNNLVTGVYYRRCNTDAINQNIYSILFDYETGATYDSTESQLQLRSYGSDFNTTVVEFALAGSGVLTGTGIADVTTASKKALVWMFRGISTHTPPDAQFWAKITNIRVNGFSDFTGTYQADEVIKDFLTDFNPRISTDHSLIENATFTLDEFFVESSKGSLEVLKELNKYEDYNFGCWDYGSDDLPRLTYEAHDTSTIHYITSLRRSKPELSGESLENQFNAVDVEFNDPVSGKRIITRTDAHALLDNAGITRKPLSPLSVDTTSQAAANQAGDTFLADRARRQSRGGMVVVNNVKDRNGVNVPVTHIRPGKNILIRDLDPAEEDLTTMSSSDVLNGKNIFKIEQVDVDAKGHVASIQLDNEGNRLDLLLSRKGF